MLFVNASLVFYFNFEKHVCMLFTFLELSPPLAGVCKLTLTTKAFRKFNRNSTNKKKSFNFVEAPRSSNSRDKRMNDECMILPSKCGIRGCFYSELVPLFFFVLYGLISNRDKCRDGILSSLSRDVSKWNTDFTLAGWMEQP